LRRFLATHYRADLALTDLRAFRWQYRAGDDEADMACAWDGDQLVGTMGYVAFPAWWGSTANGVDMAWLTNWMVDPAYRHGTGVALLRAMQDRFPVLAALGATPENERLVGLLGWALHPRVPRWYAVIDPSACSTFALPGTDLGALRAAVVEPRGLRASVRDPLDETRECDWSLYGEMHFGTIRSHAYLQWRYRDHPAFRYDVLAAGAPGRAALAVVRSEGVTGTSTSVLRMLEFFHPADESGVRDGVALLDAIVAHAHANACAFVEWVGTAAASDATFERAGWTREAPGGELLPGRYRPPEARPFSLNLEVGVAAGIVQPPLGALFVTRGDGDADRASSTGDLDGPSDGVV
jgi:hypothetical protein